MDSCLALARLADAGHDVTLVHVVAGGDGEPAAPGFLVEEQAAALGLPLALGREAELEGLLRAVAPDAVAFAGAGATRLASRLDLPSLWPAGSEAPDAVAQEAVRGGFRAFVTACRPPLDPSFLGRFLDEELLADLRATGAGNGDYDTLVVDGPLFRRRVDAMAGDAVPHGDGWRLELGLRGC